MRESERKPEITFFAGPNGSGKSTITEFIKPPYRYINANPMVNVERVKCRVLVGGHDVPEEKVILRYDRALALIPEVIKCCDVCHIYDNTYEPFRILK